jgi:hypothetical protein
MKEKIITIKPTNITQKQWAILLLELNILRKAWKSYGVDMEMSAPGIKKIIEWGTKPYAEVNRRSRKKLAQDERSEI